MDSHCVDARGVQIPDSARSSARRASERANERDGGVRRERERERDVMKGACDAPAEICDDACATVTGYGI